MDSIRYEMSENIKKRLSSPRWSKRRGRKEPAVLCKSGPSITLKEGDACEVTKFEDKDRPWVVIYCMDRGFGEGELSVIADNALISPQVKGIYIYIYVFHKPEAYMLCVLSLSLSLITQVSYAKDLSTLSFG